jgi:ATP-dependent DNA helicase RecG
MKSPIEKLYKFLSLEVERGFDDRAVHGGLRSILSSWEAEARAAEIPAVVIQAVTARLRDYHQLTPPSREEILMGLWRRVQRSAGEPVPDLFSREPPAGSPGTAPPVSEPEPAPAPPPANSTDLSEPEPGPAGNEVQPDRAVIQTEPDTRPVKSRRGAGNPYPIPPVVAPEEAAALSASLQVISGIGPKIAERLEGLGIRTLGDALYFFPRRYEDYSRLEPINRLQYGQTVTVIGTVDRVQIRPIRGGRKLVEALISDGSGAIRVTWFNQPWLADQLRGAGTISVSGTIEQYLGRLVMNSPEWEPLDSRNLNTQRIVPIYPLTGKISQKWLRGKIKEIVDYWAGRVREPLTERLLSEAGLMPISAALRQIHYPDSEEDLEAARHRLAFDEIFALQVKLLMQRREWTEREARRFGITDDVAAAWLAGLPFELTGAQKSAVADLRHDLASGRPMNRLLQGDVGSGKTVVAALALGIVVASGAQTAVMAPTGILAEQHYQSFTTLLASEGGLLQPEQIRLLVGSTPESEKAAIREALENGWVKLVIGTHALLEPNVVFQDLHMIVIDEQHRFGVRQRATLREKGPDTHLLVMTATPIPRSLALTVYGDLDLSVMDELPPGRQEIGTYLLRPVERERAYTLIKRQVETGRQSFIIYPLVEEGANGNAMAAVEEHERLQSDIFPNLNLGLLHGRLSGDEKEDTMRRFRDGEVDVLISTSVVEVGVDVPNATVMVVEGANRFGLAQLHQFRGRIGRGAEKSYCLLIPDEDDALENERLQAMVETDDGFVLAERDLEQRGPGDFLGVRQSGYSGLKLASITDVRLVEKARRFAQEVFERDPDLSDPDHALLGEQIAMIWDPGDGDMS